jgi:hypothetical protein
LLAVDNLAVGLAGLKGQRETLWLTVEEVDEILKSQFVISSMRSQVVTASKRNIRYRPFAFTQQGIGMLSGI